jgi:3-oxoacyl-[acyl-carrier protein] reductase
VRSAQLTPSLAKRFAPQRVTVNCVDPGPVDTGYAHEAPRGACEHVFG